MNTIRIFDPTNCKPEDYRHKYPELERIPEFDNIPPRGLIFAWWFSNKSSDLVLYTPDDYERAEEALKRSGFNPGKVERDQILKLQFNSALAMALKRMADFDPGARYKAYCMIKKIFDHYQRITDLGPEAFQTSTVEGKGDSMITSQYTDYKRYVDVSAKISEELPSLLTKLEEGFAVVTVTGEEIEAGKNSDLHEWHEAREN
jgi:hypothetical protein